MAITTSMRRLLAHHTASRINRAFARNKRCEISVRTFGFFSESPFTKVSVSSREHKFQERIQARLDYPADVYVTSDGKRLTVIARKK